MLKKFTGSHDPRLSGGVLAISTVDLKRNNGDCH